MSDWRFARNDIVPVKIPWGAALPGTTFTGEEAAGLQGYLYAFELGIQSGRQQWLGIRVYRRDETIARGIDAPDLEAAYLAQVFLGPGDPDLVLIADLPALRVFVRQWEPLIRLAMETRRERELREHLDTHAEANRWRDCRYCRTDPVPQLISWGNGTYSKG